MSPSTSFKSAVFCRVIADRMLREFATTRYPFAISLFATARPIPRDAPVTTATLVAKEYCFTSSGLFEGSLPALHFITLSFSFLSLALNPLVHIGRATNQCDPLFLARTQESDYVGVHKCDLMQVQDHAFTVVVRYRRPIRRMRRICLEPPRRPPRGGVGGATLERDRPV